MLVDSYANFKYLFQFLFAFSYCATTIKSFFFLITCLLLIKACLKFLSLTNFSNLLSFDKSVIHSSPIFCRKLRIKIIISNEIILHLTSVLLELEEGVKHKLVSSNLMYDLCINKQHNIFFLSLKNTLTISQQRRNLPHAPTLKWILENLSTWNWLHSLIMAILCLLHTNQQAKVILASVKSKANTGLWALAVSGSP